MRLKFAVIFATLVFACYGVAMGDGVSIDHVDGTYDATHIMENTEVTFHVRMSAPDAGHQGITNGFVVYSPNNPAVNWTTLTADTTGAIGGVEFDLLWLINYYGVTGQDRDTVGFAGSIFFGAGMPQGFDAITHTITIGPIASDFVGDSLCLDSTYYPPSGLWKWAGADIIPTWDGPHCYYIGEESQVDPPVITCPEPTGFDLCGAEQVCLDVAITNVTNEQVSVDNGATWADGQLCFTPDTAGLYSFHITATNDGGTDECDAAVAITYYDPVAIDCPPEPIPVSISEAGQVCVALAVTNYTTVTPDFGTWANDQLCFQADTSGSYVITVDAAGTPPECEYTDQCVVTVNVTITPLQPPVIDCPSAAIDFAPCSQSGNLCTDLAITNVTNEQVTVDNGGTWADGQLCFDYDGAASVTFHVTATNDDGTDECDVTVNVAPTPLVAIDCPAGDVPVTIGGPGEACVPLPITNNGAVSVVVGSGSDTFGGTWADDQLCFTANTEGSYPVMVTAQSTNPGCPPDVCNFNVVVTYTVNVEIDCPPEPFVLETCVGGTVGMPITVINADSVTVDQGSWVGDGISFAPPSSGTYTFNLIAYGDETTDECTVTADITILDAPMIECPGVQDFTICEGEEICIDVPITNASSVTTTYGNWNDNVFCFTPDGGSGTYSPWVIATNVCGADTCALEINVTFYDAPTAAFTPMPSEGPAPLTVEFDNMSTGESLTYTWNFGDGSASSEFEPMHTFEAAGCYDVTLTVEDMCGVTASATHEVCATEDEIVVPSDRWMVVGCENATLNDEPLVEGDMIAARDLDGVLCGLAYADVNGGFVLTIYGNSPHTAYDEGPEDGEMVYFEINGVPVESVPAVNWVWGDVLNICQFTSGPPCLTYELDAGWHLISWNLNYQGSIEEFVGMMGGCVDVVMSFHMSGMTYDPLLPQFSTLHTVDYYHGYWVRLNCPVTFDICGDMIGDGDYIDIYSGWNLVSYWPDEVLPLGDALVSIWDMVEVVYGYDHGFYDYVAGGDPLYMTLTDMGPGFGYWIKSSGDGMLSYPGFGSPLARPAVAYQLPEMAGTRNWMSIYGENVAIDGQPVAEGAQVEVYTTSGVLVGSGEYTGNRLQFTSVYGYDAGAEDYPRAGDRLDLRIDGVSQPIVLTMADNGARVDLNSLAKGEAVVPQSFRLMQNYPNPFNPTTTIAFSLPNSSNVQLSVFNILGQEVVTLIDDQMAAGEHDIVWDGKDASGSSVTSGVYFYRLATDRFNETKKMILMK